MEGGEFVQNRYLSCSDIATLTGRKIKTVWSWCRTGKLKASRPSGRDYIIKEEDFERFMSGETTQRAGDNS
ncbi:helix-turn-helix domain-containing protein [Pseudoflavonifractor sp. MCC625]|nr:helix-turn-helix domain-containing protein [Pseudoflavonifractor sp. MCC625]